MDENKDISQKLLKYCRPKLESFLAEEVKGDGCVGFGSADECNPGGGNPNNCGFGDDGI